MHVPWRKRISRAIRGELRARVLSRHGEGILANTRNGLLIVDPRDFSISRSLLKHGEYDWAAIEWLCRALTEHSRIVFVGAHIGTLLVPIALKSGSRNIVAFEPSPTNHRLLSMNLALNGLQAVALHRVAAGDAAGAVRFAHNRINSGNSRISPAGDIEVQVSRLDDVLENAADIDMLVMDTEGFEVRAMRGAAATLGKTRYFYVEYAPDQLVDQGSRPEEFIEVAADLFRSMYLPGDPVRFFADRSFVKYLRELPPQRSLLLNLLFTNDASARPELLGKA
jgi:FkbM family methyltransferase